MDNINFIWFLLFLQLCFIWNDKCSCYYLYMLYLKVSLNRKQIWKHFPYFEISKTGCVNFFPCYGNDSLACVTGGFLGEIFIFVDHIILYSPARSNKKNEASSSHPFPPSAFVRFISYFTSHKRKNKQKKPPSMQAMKSETKVKLKLVMRISS